MVLDVEHDVLGVAAHERRAGFVKGLKAHKLKLERDLDIKAAYTFQSGVEAGRKLTNLVVMGMGGISRGLIHEATLLVDRIGNPHRVDVLSA